MSINSLNISDVAPVSFSLQFLDQVQVGAEFTVVRLKFEVRDPKQCNSCLNRMKGLRAIHECERGFSGHHLFGNSICLI